MLWLFEKARRSLIGHRALLRMDAATRYTRVSRGSIHTHRTDWLDFDVLAYSAPIDAPDSHQPCSDGAGVRYLCGSRAAEPLSDIIGRNGRVKCTEKERDRYCRIVAVCFAGATDINREMVRRGWAIEYRKYFGRPIRRCESRGHGRKGRAMGRDFRRAGGMAQIERGM